MAPGASRLALLVAAAAASPTAAPTSALCGVTVGNRTNLDTGGLKAAWEAAGYDRTLRPLEATTGSPNAPPELVQVGALLLGFSLDEANTNWSPRYFQRTQWVDPRLAYDVPAGCDVAYVYLGAYEWRTYLWRPIPYVKNLARWVDGHQLAGGIWVYPDGTVFESRLVNDELTCRLDVTKMPFDTQKCEIVYGMYINDETSVQLRLLPQPGGPVEIDDAKYNVQNTWKLGPRRGWETLVTYFGGSQWMEVTLQVEVYRRSAYYVSTVMIPCVLFLFIQYAGFFVDRHVAPARVAISVVPVLIMLTLSSDVFEKIQRVSYSVYLVSFVNLASYITWACTLHYGLVQYFLSHEHAGTARRLHLVRIQSIDESALRRRAPRAAQRASRIRTFQRRLSEHAAKARRASVWDRAAKPRASTTRKHRASLGTLLSLENSKSAHLVPAPDAPLAPGALPDDAEVEAGEAKGDGGRARAEAAERNERGGDRTARPVGEALEHWAEHVGGLIDESLEAQYAARDAADAAAASTSALPPPPIVSLDILAEVFHRHDRNGDGVIDEAEMRMALRHYSIFCSAAHAGLEIRAYHPVCESNLQPDFNVRVIERFGPDSFAVLRKLDESNRFVQKSAKSTST